MMYEGDFIYPYCKGYHIDFPQNNCHYILKFLRETVLWLPFPPSFKILPTYYLVKSLYVVFSMKFLWINSTSRNQFQGKLLELNIKHQLTMLKQHLSKNTIAYRKIKSLYNQAFDDSNENLSTLILASYNGLIILLKIKDQVSPIQKRSGKNHFCKCSYILRYQVISTF